MPSRALQTLPGYRPLGRDTFEVDVRVPEVVIRDHLPAWASFDFEYDAQRANEGLKVVRVRMPYGEDALDDRASYDGRVAPRYYGYSEARIERRGPETDAELRARILDRMHGDRPAAPDTSEVETATDEHLRAIADLYGVERREPTAPEFTVDVPGAIHSIAVNARMVLDFEAALTDAMTPLRRTAAASAALLDAMTPPRRTAWDRIDAGWLEEAA